MVDSFDSVCSAHDVETIASAYLLQQQEHMHSADRVGTYHLHGWRWHCMSVLREMKVLQTLVQRTDDDDDDDDETKQSPPSRTCISSLTDYIIGFNMKGLHRVESKLFFPWLETKLNRIHDAAARDAFQRILMAVVEYQSQLTQQGQLMVRTCVHRV